MKVPFTHVLGWVALGLAGWAIIGLAVRALSFTQILR